MVTTGRRSASSPLGRACARTNRSTIQDLPLLLGPANRKSGGRIWPGPSRSNVSSRASTSCARSYATHHRSVGSSASRSASGRSAAARAAGMRWVRLALFVAAGQDRRRCWFRGRAEVLAHKARNTGATTEPEWAGRMAIDPRRIGNTVMVERALREEDLLLREPLLLHPSAPLMGRTSASGRGNKGGQTNVISRPTAA